MTGQLPLPFARDEGSLRQYFCAKTGKGISLVLTDNRSVMISLQKKGDKINVRLQRAFLQAGDDIIDEIAEFIKKGKGRTPLLRRFIREKNFLPAGNSRPPVNLRKAGKFHDLGNLFDSVNREYFGSRINAAVTWGTRNSRCRVRRRTLGSYSPFSNTIRINPVLDRRNVPTYFVRFILYHEMLHAEMGVKQKNNRRFLHPKEFRAREKLFREYEKALVWERRGSRN